VIQKRSVARHSESEEKCHLNSILRLLLAASAENFTRNITKNGLRNELSHSPNIANSKQQKDQARTKSPTHDQHLNFSPKSHGA